VPSRIAGHTCRSAVSPLSERWLRHPSTSSTTESGLPNETNAAREAERTFRFHPVAAEDVITRSTFQPRLWMHWDNCDLVQGVASLAQGRLGAAPRLLTSTSSCPRSASMRANSRSKAAASRVVARRADHLWRRSASATGRPLAYTVQPEVITVAVAHGAVLPGEEPDLMAAVGVGTPAYHLASLFVPTGRSPV
jgi:hypothetical protein